MTSFLFDYRTPSRSRGVARPCSWRISLRSMHVVSFLAKPRRPCSAFAWTFCIYRRRKHIGESPPPGYHADLLLTMLEDGRLHLCGIAVIAKHLTEANCEEVLARATHKSKRELEELVAELAPKPDVPPTIRKKPQPKAQSGSSKPSKPSDEHRAQRAEARGENESPPARPAAPEKRPTDGHRGTEKARGSEEHSAVSIVASPVRRC